MVSGLKVIQVTPLCPANTLSYNYWGTKIYGSSFGDQSVFM